MPMRLAYLGPPGTFGEEAACAYRPDAEAVPLPSHAAVAAAVESDRAAAGILAIENSLNGSVAETLDILIHETSLRMQAELVVPVVHNLVLKPGANRTKVKVIHSHPQALGQCRLFLEREYPDATLVASLSTAEAVKTVMRGDGTAAAVATARAAELHGGDLAVTGIQDKANNVTRFIVLGRESPPPSGRDRTSIAFTFAVDRPGSLSAVLNAFAGRGLNCSKIESRPTREVFGEYVFLVDFEGHELDPKPADALAEVKGLTETLKVFGSYPRWR